MITSTAVAMAWRKSSRCESHTCLEVAEAPGGRMAVRNSTRPELRISFEGPAWQAFVRTVRDGDLGSH